MGKWLRIGPCQVRREPLAMALFRGLYIRWQASAGVALKCLAKNAPVAQLDRASDYESEGRTFESFRARHYSKTQLQIGASSSPAGNRYFASAA